MNEIYSANTYKPKECIGVGNAVGTCLGQEGMVIVGRDGKYVSRLVKRALTLGLASAGTSCIDLRLVPYIVVEHEIKRQNASAGVYVYFENKNVRVNYYGDLNKIKNAIKSKKKRMVGINKLGSILFYPNGIEDYVDDFTKKLSFKKEMNILVSCTDTPMTLIIPSLFKHYGLKEHMMHDLISDTNSQSVSDVFRKILRDKEFDAGIKFLFNVMKIYNKEGKIIYNTKNLENAILHLRDM